MILRCAALALLLAVSGARAEKARFRWEGLPLVLLEAQAAGVPVVATAADGAPEALSGQIYRPGDVEGAVARMLRLLDDRACAAHLEQMARLIEGT